MTEPISASRFKAIMQENRTFPQSFAYALGNFLSIYAYVLGKFYAIFAYALGKRTIFAAVI